MTFTREKAKGLKVNAVARKVERTDKIMEEMNGPIRLGDRVRDKVNGFVGIAIDYTDYISGCRAWGVEPEELKDGNIQVSSLIIEPRLCIVKSQVHNAPADVEVKIKFGDHAKDIHTGFEGYVSAITKFLFHEPKITMRGLDLKKGEPRDAHWFDVSHVKLVKEEAVKRTVKDAMPASGGPDGKSERVVSTRRK